MQPTTGEVPTTTCYSPGKSSLSARPAGMPSLRQSLGSGAAGWALWVIGRLLHLYMSNWRYPPPGDAE
jgi:hypothetical protein